MKFFAALFFIPLFLSAEEPVMSAKTRIDFSEGAVRSTGRITDDGVMGGLSKGQVRKTDDGTAVFSGTLSLKNNGGFSSWEIEEGEWDLSAFDGIQLKVKGDGRRYKLRLATNETYRFSRVAFQAEFATVKGEWTTVEVPFSSLRASWRGRALENPFDPSRVRTIGIILADKKEGPFTLEVRRVGTWKRPSAE